MDRATRIKERTEYLLKEASTIEAMKDRLSKEHSVPRDAKFDKAWKLAWDYGHSGGYHEVEMCFSDFVELIK